MPTKDDHQNPTLPLFKPESLSSEGALSMRQQFDEPVFQGTLGSIENKRPRNLVGLVDCASRRPSQIRTREFSPKGLLPHIAARLSSSS